MSRKQKVQRRPNLQNMTALLSHRKKMLRIETVTPTPLGTGARVPPPLQMAGHGGTVTEQQTRN